MTVDNCSEETLNYWDELVMANSHIKEGQYEKAKLILESLVKRNFHQPFIYLALGDVCRSISNQDQDTSILAKKYYLIAIDLATYTGNRQVIVAAKAGLTKVYIRETIAAYNELYDYEKWEELENILPQFHGCQESPGEYMPAQYMLMMGNCGDCTTSQGRTGIPLGSGFCKGCFRPS
jgi:tetratricopeptide (TPR) repeat protein